MMRPVILAGSLLASLTTAALECTTEALAATLPSNARIVSTTQLANNSTFQVPVGNLPYPTSPSNLQALCAVQVNVVSSNASNFEFGLFLPSDWNQRFLAVGNGGFGGGINWLDMGAGVRYGFASMSTDTGHNSSTGDITWALNQPEKKIDWGYRAMHGSVVTAKQIIQAYYGTASIFNYYSGCSTGGRQGLRELQLYPEDFDGVLAGAPAWWTSHLQTWTIKVGLYNLPVDGPNRIDPSLFPAIEAEILSQCDAQDGLRDTVISDPRGCNVFLEALLCTPNSGNSTSACLTPAQLQTVTDIYTDYIDTNQTLVFPRLEPGSEAQWPVLLGGSEPNSLGTEYVQFFLDRPDFDYNDFDYSIVQLADQVQPGNATAYDYNLQPFNARGGKLVMYHGLADALISPGSSEYFYRQVYRTMAPNGVVLDDFYRLFLVPGMQHCSGTPKAQQAPWYFAGANQAGSIGTGVFSTPGFSDARHDALLALMEWVEAATAPESIIATRWQNDTPSAGVQRQRPICVYPKQPRFQGGDEAKEENWRCEDISNGLGVQAGY